MRQRQPDRFARNLLPWTVLAVIALVGCGGGDEPLPEATPGGSEETDEIAAALEALKAPEPDKVVATVNGTEIRAGKVYEVAAINMLNLEAQGQTLSEQEERNLRMSILEMIINDELLAQEAEALGITVEDVDGTGGGQIVHQRIIPGAAQVTAVVAVTRRGNPVEVNVFGGIQGHGVLCLLSYTLTG